MPTPVKSEEYSDVAIHVVFPVLPPHLERHLTFMAPSPAPLFPQGGCSPPIHTPFVGRVQPADPHSRREAPQEEVYSRISPQE
jgi:hypothetical protein